MIRSAFQIGCRCEAMMFLDRVKTLKRELGSRYGFRILISEREVRELMKQNPSEFEMQTAAFLAAGCVKIEVTLYRQNGRMQLGYDVFCSSRTILTHRNGSVTTAWMTRSVSGKRICLLFWTEW